MIHWFSNPDKTAQFTLAENVTQKIKAFAWSIVAFWLNNKISRNSKLFCNTLKKNLVGDSKIAIVLHTWQVCSMILIFKSRQCAHWQKMSLKSNGMVSAQLIQRTSHFFENNFHRVKVAMIPSVFAQKNWASFKKPSCCSCSIT